VQEVASQFAFCAGLFKGEDDGRNLGLNGYVE